MSAIAPVSRVTAAFVAQLNENFDYLNDQVDNFASSPFVSIEAFGAAGDGVTDDSDAFRAAIADGGPILLDGGKTYAMRDVEVPDTSGCPGVFSIGGQARIVPGAGATAGSVCFLVRKPAGFAVDGLFFDLPVSTNPAVAPVFDRALLFAPTGNTGTRYRVSNCRFSGATNAISCWYITANSRIDRNYITATWSDAITMQCAQNVDITDNIIEDSCTGTGSNSSGAIRCGYSLQIDSSLNLLISRNTIVRCYQTLGQSAIDCFSGSARNIQISNNFLEVNGGGIELKTMDWALGSPNVYRNNLVANNVIRVRTDVASTSGITLFYAVTGTVPGKSGRMLVTGNIISGVNPPTSGADILGIVANGFDDITISGNHIDTVARGIAVSGAGESDNIASRIVISGNSIDTVDAAISRSADASTIDGLFIVGNPLIRTTTADESTIELGSGTTTGSEISGNVIENTGGWGIELRDVQASRICNNSFRTAKACIYSAGAVSANLAITHNRLTSTVGPALDLAAGTAIRVQGNDVGVPVGSRTVSGAASFAAADNSRGTRTAIPDATFGGALGDTFSDSTAATAGWRCTTAGVAGVAVWTAI